MLKNMAKYLVVVFLFGSLALWSCKMPQQVKENGTTGQGIAMLKIMTTANSPFKKIARTAVLLISASDMIDMTKTLTITDTSVEGVITGIPAGKNRLFQVNVYDSSETMQYRGSATADVIADSMVSVTIKIFRIGGGAIINGTVVDDTIMGLIAYYPFNGNANDESGNGFNATVNGPVLTTDRFGNPNKAYFFNGKGGMVATINSLFSVPKFTIAAWFKSNGIAASGVPRIVSITRPGECNGYYELLYANGYWIGSPNDYSKKLICYLDDPSSGYDYNLYFSKSAPDTISWHLGVITLDSGNLKFYIDGVNDTIISDLPPITQFVGSAILQIGYCDAGGNFNGKLDDIRIYNRALSDAEIQNIFSLAN